MRPLYAVVTAALILTAIPAAAQIALPGGGLPQSLPQSLPGVVDRLPVGAGRLQDLTGDLVDTALQAPARLGGLIRRSRGALEADPQGWPIVSDEIVVLGLTEADRARVLASGFTLVREERLASLGLSSVVLAPPRRQSMARAIRRLREIAPEAETTFNHVYAPAGLDAETEIEAAAPVASPQAHPSGSSRARLGLIDTGIEATHPALAASQVEQRGFAGPPRMGAHGTAVASLMVGQFGAFEGGDPGAALLVADIYGGQAAGGSSTGLALALDWMVERHVSVVNISLVGPRNALVARAVAAAQAQGLTLVAAVGNDGPAAPLLFPAAYPGVVGVTGVSGRDQALPEAARGPQVDFAAPGADMAAAGAAGGWVAVRGSSFAAPLVAGVIAHEGGVEAAARTARDLGAPGPDPIYGRGLIAADRQVAPSTMNARGRL
jgi:hypothetical protein